VKRLFLKAAGVAAAGALLKACGGGGGTSAVVGGGGGGTPSGSLTLLQVVQQDARFTSLLGAVQRAGLTGLLSQAGASQTLFAPTNDAFSQLDGRVGGLSDAQLASILNFHVVPEFLSGATLASLGLQSGTKDTLYNFDGAPAALIFVDNGGTLNIWDGIGRNSITLGQTDVAASNGVLHVVNDVLLPRGVLTVADMLSANIDSFANFRARMSQADLDLLNGAGLFTVFVPSNDAAGTITVRRHVLERQIGSVDFPATAIAITMVSRAVSRLARGSGQVVNGRTVLGTLTDASPQSPANITDVDFYGTNGVIHVLDKVLL
jgi:uncharacterized surface protein with fasciclin (FAS1) repeats